MTDAVRHVIDSTEGTLTVDPNPNPNEPKIDPGAPGVNTEPQPEKTQPDDVKKDTTPTKDPGFQDVDPIDGSLNPVPTVTVTATPAPANVSDSVGLAMVPWVLVVLLFVAAVALAAMLMRRGRRPASAPMPVMAPAAPAPAPDPAASPVVPELVTLADLITTPAAQTQVVRTLRTVGVEPVDATVGAPFNPDVHEAVATRPAEDPSQVGTIAVVHRAGWRSARGVVRPAGVEVWTADGDGA